MSKNEAYVSIATCKEVVSALKDFVRLTNEESNSGGHKDGNKKKPLPLGDADDEQGQKVLVQIDFKKIPLNKTTYINWYGPLPHPWIVASDLDICLVVPDLDRKKSLPDRDLDLTMTRDHYKAILTEDGTGLSKEFVNRRIYILTMRELLTEYKEHEAKGKLAAAYDVFLADRKLLNNKFKELNTFLGTKFWTKFKKTPHPVDMSKRGDSLGEEISSVLEQTSLYVSGKGASETVQVGVYKQTNNQIGYNISFVLNEVQKQFGKNIATLRLKTTKSIGIPFYADLGSANDIDPLDCGPRTKALGEASEVVDDFSLFNNVDLSVSATGDVKILRKRTLEEGDKDDDQYVAGLEKRWIRETSKRKRFPRQYLFVKRPAKRVQQEKSVRVRKPSNTLRSKLARRPMSQLKSPAPLKRIKSPEAVKETV